MQGRIFFIDLYLLTFIDLYLLYFYRSYNFCNLLSQSIDLVSLDLSLRGQLEVG